MERERLKNTKRITRVFGKCRVSWVNGAARVYSIAEPYTHVYMTIHITKKGWRLYYNFDIGMPHIPTSPFIEGPSLAELALRLRTIMLLTQ